MQVTHLISVSCFLQWNSFDWCQDVASYAIILLGTTSHQCSPCCCTHTKPVFEGSAVHSSRLVLGVHLPGKQSGMTATKNSIIPVNSGGDFYLSKTMGRNEIYVKQWKANSM